MSKDLNMKVTLEDVALASGVSKATASYVINNKKSSFGLSPQTVKRVLQESQRLNYRPDLIAQALAEQKRAPLSIMILSPWLHSQFSDFMVQVSHAVESASLEMKIHADYKLYKCGDLKRTLRPMKCSKYDAVIVLGTNLVDDAFLEKKRGEYTNVILLNRMKDGYASSCGNDDVMCATLAKRLIAGDYYKKYVLSVSGTASHRERLRTDSYRKLLAKVGKDHFCEHLDAVPDVPENDQLRLLFEQYGSNKVCYIFTQYFPAARLMNFAINAGLKVPEEVGIVGYDQHSLLKDFLNPRLTTIDPGVFEMTRQALAMARMMKDGQSPANMITEAVIVGGGSAILG